MDTCNAFLSASLYTETVLMPRLLAVLITLQAISPLLAINIFSMVAARIQNKSIINTVYALYLAVPNGGVFQKQIY